MARIDDAVLAPLVSARERAAILTDFDGTLAPIVEDPAAAAPLAGTADVLSRLGARFAVVGVVSGRPARYLLDHLGAAAPVLALRGLYGLERVDDGVITERPGLDRWRHQLDAVTERAGAEAPAGVEVEGKGLAVTIHVRNAPDADRWLDEFAASVAATTGLATHPGRRSVEIRPPVDVDKGTVVRDLAAGMEAACFLGDDRGDLPAFAALAELRAGGMATLAVAVASAEAPAELIAAADVILDGPEGALELLRRLAAAD